MQSKKGVDKQQGRLKNEKRADKKRNKIKNKKVEVDFTTEGRGSYWVQ